MLLGSWKQFFFLKVVTCALRSAQHWAHFSVAIALVSSNVHHSNLAPWWQRGDVLCKQFQHIWITGTNGSRDLANLRPNFVRGVYSSFGWLARARMSSWRPLSHLATEDCAKTADFHRRGDPVGASWSRVSWVVVSWWCGECFGLSLALTYSAFFFSRNCCPLELPRFGKLWAELWPQFRVPLFFAEARTLQTRCMPLLDQDQIWRLYRLYRLFISQDFLPCRHAILIVIYCHLTMFLTHFLGPSNDINDQPWLGGWAPGADPKGQSLGAGRSCQHHAPGGTRCDHGYGLRKPMGVFGILADILTDLTDLTWAYSELFRWWE